MKIAIFASITRKPIIILSLHKLIDRYGAWAAAIAAAAIMGAATWAAQRFAMPELEEENVFLWHWPWMRQLLLSVGGFATIASSFFTQFMQRPWVGAMLMAAYYGALTLMLCGTGRKLGMRPWAITAALLPCVCLWLCLENSAYKPQGHAAYAIAVAALWLYSRLGCSAHCSAESTLKGAVRTAVCAVAAACAYWLIGPDGLLLSLAMLLFDILCWRPRWWMSLACPAAAFAAAFACRHADLVPTNAQAYGPGMYYLWDSTAYMQTYAWCALGIFLCIARLRIPSSACWQAVAAAIAAAAIGAFAFNTYAHVHNARSYRVKAQRYYAKERRWDDILAMDYSRDRDGTPYTSYCFLAMAHKGTLASQIAQCRPYIGYYMANKKLVQKEDLQIFSDIFFDCNYLGAARKAAFDTDIVTSGPFNPVETMKLVDINIAYGDYAVADKLIGKLEKTLFYREWARQRRPLLGNDSLICAHPQLGPMRKAIPAEDSYLEPRHTGRDLRRIAEADPSQLVASQFMQAFTILTNIND